MSQMQTKSSVKDETIRTAKCCYLSSPEHVRSLVGCFFYIYTDKGCLRLTSDSLLYSGKKNTIDIPLDSITHVARGNYSRFAKPIRLDYMSVKFSSEGQEKNVYFTPTKYALLPVWKTNEIVDTWIGHLNEATCKK